MIFPCSRFRASGGLRLQLRLRMRTSTYLQIRVHAIQNRHQHGQYQPQKYYSQHLDYRQDDGYVLRGAQDLIPRGYERGYLREGRVDFAGVGDAHFDLCRSEMLGGYSGKF